MIKPTTLNELFLSPDGLIILDVRTPAEYNHGHIPKALNLPLFSNEERIVVGTTYKKESREAAILKGFEIVGPKWAGFITQALTIAPKKKVVLHCWRGGMRSEAMAWALDIYGFDVYVIKGGYKAFRRWTYEQFEKKYNLHVVGGMTGSGKTKALHELAKMGEQVVDLEELAQHKGSAYGTMNKLIQPTQEQFENNLAFQLSMLNAEKITWIEDENRSIGRRQIPAAFWRQTEYSPLFDIRVPVEYRINQLVNEYCSLDKNFLIESTERIRKRLGPLNFKNAIEAINEDRFADFIKLVLLYYDKAYRAALTNKAKELVAPVIVEQPEPLTIAEKLKEMSKAFNHKNIHV
ncbi:MAG: tRNA 2-selenouridine(34) synthase MnmH [Chitinophagaceae bacterium]